MRRVTDVAISIAALTLLSPLLVIIGLAVRMTSQGPVLFVSDRIGQRNATFRMYKFRTMRIDTPQLATHKMADPRQYLTPIGGFLRRTSLDELPQFINVLKGDMSLVGPRPALFNQDDLIELRTARGVHTLRPGITGWAQINGRDSLPIPDKVDLDAYYLEHRSARLDMRILMKSFAKLLPDRDVSH